MIIPLLQNRPMIIAKNFLKKLKRFLKKIDARKFFRTMRKKVSMNLDQFRLSTDTLVDQGRWKNTQYITHREKGRQSWDTFIQSHRLMRENTEGLSDFAVGTCPKKKICGMQKTGSTQANGVQAGYTDTSKVKNGKSGKHTKSGKTLSIRTQTYEKNKKTIKGRTKR